MTEKLKDFWTKLKELLKKVSKKVYILTALILVALVAVVVLMTLNRPYSVLFTGLSATETSSILSYLEESGVTDYKVENNDTILVPRNQEAQLKAALLMEGYPQSGFSYDYSTYYNNVGSLSTESERNQAALHDLQDQMSAVVRCFTNVKNATVNIAMGEDTSFVLDADRVVDASAGVLVEMEGVSKLTSDQAAAIRRYIASGVRGLEIDRVEITDTMGNRYSTADSTADADASALKIQLEEEWENKVRTNVMQVLIPFFGEDNVKVGVNVNVDVSQTVEDSTEVFLPDYAQDGSTDGKGILGAIIYDHSVIRDGDNPVGGTVGSETNSDLPEYVEDLPSLDGSEQEIHTSGEEIFDNSRTEKHIIRTAGYITDCSISVSINSDEAGAVNLQDIRRHVARAAGIQGVTDEQTGEEYLEDKISVVSMPFWQPPSILPPASELPVPEWVIFAAAGGLLLFLILLFIILMIIRRKRKKKKEQELQMQQLASVDEILAAAGMAQAPVTGADVMSMQTEKSMELRKDIRQFAEENPEIAAQMIKGWLRGGDDNG